MCQTVRVTVLPCDGCAVCVPLKYKKKTFITVLSTLYCKVELYLNNVINNYFFLQFVTKNFHTLYL